MFSSTYTLGCVTAQYPLTVQVVSHFLWPSCAVSVSSSCNKQAHFSMPNHVLHRTKRYLHHKCCKPTDMKVCMFYTYLSNMILNELNCLPCFGNNQLLAADEVVDILLFTTPTVDKSKWRNRIGTLLSTVPVKSWTSWNA
jgi:hypothetical protein